uniref:Uncharacterized protein n=1 Tax=Opuntia streptacantha TaxID=393608 RepID=A0A7C9EDK8_OPUST
MEKGRACQGREFQVLLIRVIHVVIRNLLNVMQKHLVHIMIVRGMWLMKPLKLDMDVQMLANQFMGRNKILLLSLLSNGRMKLIKMPPADQISLLISMTDFLATYYQLYFLRSLLV